VFNHLNRKYRCLGLTVASFCDASTNVNRSNLGPSKHKAYLIIQAAEVGPTLIILIGVTANAIKFLVLAAFPLYRISSLRNKSVWDIIILLYRDFETNCAVFTQVLHLCDPCSVFLIKFCRKSSSKLVWKLLSRHRKYYNFEVSQMFIRICLSAFLRKRVTYLTYLF
jgi:hypothetical protein